MSHAISKGKYPKQPNETVVLTTCREDFRKFKERNGALLLEHLSTLIKDLEKRGINPEIYKNQKQELEEIRELVIKGTEKVAFTRFTRAFPYPIRKKGLL